MTNLSTDPKGNAVTDREVETLMTSSRVLYRQLSAAAAALERAGIYPDAAEQWRQAGALAPGERSRFWCEVREARCLRATPREIQSYGQVSGKRRRKVAPGEVLG